MQAFGNKYAQGSPTQWISKRFKAFHYLMWERCIQKCYMSIKVKTLFTETIKLQKVKQWGHSMIVFALLFGGCVVNTLSVDTFTEAYSFDCKQQSGTDWRKEKKKAGWTVPSSMLILLFAHNHDFELWPVNQLTTWSPKREIGAIMLWYCDHMLFLWLLDHSKCHSEMINLFWKFLGVSMMP